MKTRKRSLRTMIKRIYAGKEPEVLRALRGLDGKLCACDGVTHLRLLDLSDTLPIERSFSTRELAYAILPEDERLGRFYLPAELAAL